MPTSHHTTRIAWLGLLALLLALSSVPSAATNTYASPQASTPFFLPMLMRAEAPSSDGSTPVDGLPFDPSSTRSGVATFYGADGEGSCSFDAFPNDLMVAAMNHVDYANAWLCGAYVEVAGPSGTVTVRIVDMCPECNSGHIDLSRQAFERIANPDLGRVPISWRVVSPALNGPIAYRFKEGSSQYWTAIQIRNHRTPIWKVEYLTAAGAYKELVRQSYNYFIASPGMGVGPYTLRVSDIYGRSIVDTGIPLREAQVVQGSGQFPAP